MSRTTDALQRALAGEHAAVWGYGLIGAYLRGAAQRQARADETAHRRLRDAAITALTAAKVTPVAADPAYRTPFAVRTPAAALRLGVHLEDATAAVWYSMLEMTEQASDRTTASAALTGAAERATGWRRRISATAPPTVPFPGRPETKPGS